MIIIYSSPVCAFHFICTQATICSHITHFSHVPIADASVYQVLTSFPPSSSSSIPSSFSPNLFSFFRVYTLRSIHRGRGIGVCALTPWSISVSDFLLLVSLLWAVYVGCSLFMCRLQSRKPSYPSLFQCFPYPHSHFFQRFHQLIGVPLALQIAQTRHLGQLLFCHFVPYALPSVTPSPLFSTIIHTRTSVSVTTLFHTYSFSFPLLMSSDYNTSRILSVHIVLAAICTSTTSRYDRYFPLVCCYVRRRVMMWWLVVLSDRVPDFGTYPFRIKGCFCDG
ncbi:hypothetical protein OF83DRAFT_274833 [Amylostereum chailletii]|nr:hypothetical protein OF83DRAFT_274833 [Amylostereum chailletii]